MKAKKCYFRYEMTAINFIFINALIFASCSTKPGYYFYVNKAEQAIVDSNYVAAKTYYKKAFRKNNPGFADHYYNAYQVSILENDLEFATFNAKVLLSRGLCLDFFSAYPQIKNDSIIYKKLEEAYNSLNVNYEYKNTLERMLSDDQAIGRENLDSTLRVIHFNYEELKPLIKKYGYPAESLIGITCTPNRKGFYMPPQDLLLFHFMQRGFVGVDTILNEALSKNEINPYTYAQIMSADSKQTEYCIEPIIEMDDTLYIPKECNLKRKIIDKKRNEIGLPTIEQEIRIITYKLKFPNNNFRLPGTKATFFDFPQSVKKSFDVY